MKFLPIKSSNLFAKVDDDDFELFSQFQWRLIAGYVGRTWAEKQNGKWKTGASYLHREILGLSRNDPRDGEHKNRDPLDCQKSNLRPATRAQNLANQAKQSGFTSGFKGVSFCPMSKTKPWRAQIRIDGKNTHLGLFQTELAAALAYNEKAVATFGEFAYINPV